MLLLLKQRQVPLTCDCAEAAHALKRQPQHRSQQLGYGRIAGFIIQGLIVAADLKRVSGWDGLVALQRLAANYVWLIADFSGVGVQADTKDSISFFFFYPAFPAGAQRQYSAASLVGLLLVRDHAEHEIFNA